MRADSASSSAQASSRRQTRIRLSCEMSITGVGAAAPRPRAASGTSGSGLRNTSITAASSAGRRVGRARTRCASGVGRRMPRASVALSVSALNSRLARCCCVPLGRRQLGIGLLGMPVQRLGHACRWPRSARSSSGPAPPPSLSQRGPGAVQRMLQDRQLVGVVADVVDQPRQQHRADLRRRPRRPGRLMAARRLVARHPRHQVLARR